MIHDQEIRLWQYLFLLKEEKKSLIQVLLYVFDKKWFNLNVQLELGEGKKKEHIMLYTYCRKKNGKYHLTGNSVNSTFL